MANKYELIVVLDLSKGEEAVQAMTDSIKAKIESLGTIDTLDVLGKKTLAYEINDQKEGHYLQFNYTAESAVPQEIERVLKITDGVLRYLTVRLGE